MLFKSSAPIVIVPPGPSIESPRGVRPIRRRYCEFGIGIPCCEKLGCPGVTHGKTESNIWFPCVARDGLSTKIKPPPFC
ncbi:hypothetical protein DPMN_030639 [Dreissena polymorpha]|uniref:Uncharacterized protein n=1 Tax=Dreissena polymorpha TaxID=45954 RepID=A0A9D4RIH3_DREPO|nr:hypothetical protein DPMN_030639 [Dreissena polymorpha]